MTAIHGHRRHLFATVAARWAAIYTFGLPAAARERRREQVESDIWEQEAEGVRDGLAPFRLGFDVFERTVRGIPADILWRFQLEGPKVHFNIPFERITGAMLLVLVVLVFASTSISGYDTSRDQWESELLRLGGNPEWQGDVTVFFWTVTGVVLVAMAAAFYVALQKTAPTLATFAAFAMAASGILVIAAACIYRSVVALAHEFVDEGGEPGLVASSRSLALAMEALQAGVIVLLCGGIYALAVAAHRHRLVPRWLGAVAAVSAVCVAGSVVIGSTIDPLSDNSVDWMLIGAGLMLLLVWLVGAGLALLINRRPSAPASGEPAAAPA